MLIAAHAFAASIALLLGAVNLLHKPRGDRLHRLLGRIWVVAMYWTVISSFWITRLHPGHYSWIHLLSIWTFISLSVGLWAALTRRIELHRGFMTGSYFGLLGAFVGAVAAPVRDIPKLAVHHTATFVAAVIGCLVVAGLIVRVAHWRVDVVTRGEAERQAATQATASAREAVRNTLT